MCKNCKTDFQTQITNTKKNISSPTLKNSVSKYKLCYTLCYHCQCSKTGLVNINYTTHCVIIANSQKLG